MAQVVDLAAKRDEKNMPHTSGELSGDARCLACNHEFFAVAPSGMVWLKCDGCHLIRARFVYPVTLRGAEVWHCSCENSLFQVTRDGIYCPNCGDWQVFPK